MANQKNAALPVPWQKIHLVPPAMRRQACPSNVYDPIAVSIGPYHYGKPELQQCQNFKTTAIQMLVDCSGKSRESLYDKVHEAVAHARAFYYDGSTDAYNDQVFTEMMLGDACFLIFWMFIGPKEVVSTFLYHLGWLLSSLVNRDIFLLENQIPFQIVMSLLDFAYNGQKNQEVDVFLHQTIWGNYKQRQQMEQGQPLTLFHAFRDVLVFDRTAVAESQNIGMEHEDDIRKRHHTYLSATALKAKGIRFRWNNQNSLEAFSFTSYAYYGELQLPSWFVSRLSETFFQNMIAYELCPNNSFSGLTVTTYVKFMKLLITSPADVKVLREERILLTSLGSDEEVVNLFKRLDTYEMEDPRILMVVKTKIQEHYDSTPKTLIAEFIHKYFSSPWTVIAWFAALLLLVLSMVQTFYTVKSCK